MQQQKTKTLGQKQRKKGNKREERKEKEKVKDTDLYLIRGTKVGEIQALHKRINNWHKY